MNEEYLEHHGIKGQKWGVRRYQNYDGSYTAKGLSRYKKAAEAYEKVNTAYKKAKSDYKAGKISKEKLNKVSGDRKTARNIANNAYRRLSKDHKADKGKALAQQGYGILDLQQDRRKRSIGITLASAGAGAGLGYAQYKKTGNYYGALKTAKIASAIGEGVSLVDQIATTTKVRDLRSYYSHNSGFWKKSEAAINRIMKEYGNEK